MPHLWIRGIDPDRVAGASRTLAQELADVCQCPEDNIMLECVPTVALADGRRTASYPFVEVAWFDRGLAVQDRFAAAVDRHLREGLGLAELEVAFRVYRERDYYANGATLGAGREEAVPAAETELASLRESNRKLAEELQRARKALANAAGGMATKLREALRE